ncbi:hypothetical protein EPD60_06975 [Flaviaesturariibacter flavus]|uniref:Uncharacterized protein n=1 Tax=Flaviaesturariibacter flavus TaxID=2502780 RepID=A0A4R1BIL7_9BACT|nr:hypothetical protein [Flaviaesturariibacter flavus]TCJ17047.1 hypothetical protein EPD60_06975 [Flaviaesturariibacter flavus]
MLRLLLFLLLLPGALRAGTNAAPSLKKALAEGSVVARHSNPAHTELAPLQALVLPAARVTGHLVPGGALLPVAPGLSTPLLPHSMRGTTRPWCTAAHRYLRHNYPAHAFW